MKSIVKFAAVGLGALFVIGLFSPDDKAAQVAPAASAPAAAPVTPVAPVTPPPAATEAPVVAGPDKYGDDPELDALWDKCVANDFDACEDLYWLSPIGSEYEAFGQSSMNIANEGISEQDLIDLIGPALILDMVWSGMSAREQADLCGGVRLLGPAAAGVVVADGSSGAVSAADAAEWLADRCL